MPVATTTLSLSVGFSSIILFSRIIPGRRTGSRLAVIATFTSCEPTVVGVLTPTSITLEGRLTIGRRLVVETLLQVLRLDPGLHGLAAQGLVSQKTKSFQRDFFISEFEEVRAPTLGFHLHNGLVKIACALQQRLDILFSRIFRNISQDNCVALNQLENGFCGLLLFVNENLV